MRLVAFQVPSPLGSLARVGAVVGDGRYLDLTSAYGLLLQRRYGLPEEAAARQARALLPPSMRQLIEGGAPTLEAARAALAGHAAGELEGASDRVLAHRPESVRLLPAIPDPPLLRDFMAFEGHLKNIYPRLGRDIPPAWYEIPVYYKGNTASLGAHGETVQRPSYAQSLDFEFELAAIIGKGGSDIPPERAHEHIFGYTIYNDVSARITQAHEMSVGLGPAKGKDFAGAHVLGPWLVTADEVGDVYALSMRAEVDGRLWCEGRVGDMHWRFADMIVHASRSEPLRPGDVFGSGTAAGGSGAEHGITFPDGCEVALSIERLGTLRTRLGSKMSDG